MTSEIPDHFLLPGAASRFLRGLSVDCVIFGFHDNRLRVLLLKVKHIDRWALPGGFILNKESVDDAAVRVLKERTGLGDIYLQQFHCFGKPDRSDASLHRAILKKSGMKQKSDGFLSGRFVTIGYYALVEYSTVNPVPDEFSESCDWYDIHDLPRLMMDHLDILNRALDTLRIHLLNHPVGYNLLPPRFTMPELQALYETILDRRLDRRNFQRKMLSAGFLKRLSERKTGVAHKAPYYYKFDLRKYQRALDSGFGW